MAEQVVIVDLSVLRERADRSLEHQAHGIAHICPGLRALLGAELGTDVAVEALKEAVHRKGIPPAQLLKYARVCNVETVMLPYLEGV